MALKEGIPEGIFGGMDGNDRRKVWRTWPEGRPRIFDQVIDANTRPLLQQRRDHENFDSNAEGWRVKIDRQTARQRAKRVAMCDDDGTPINLRTLMESA